MLVAPPPLLIPEESMQFRGEACVYAEDKRYSRLEVIDLPNGEQVEVRRHPIVYMCKQGNLIVDEGRINVLQSLWHSSILNAVTPTQFAYGAVGDSNVSPTDNTKDRLQNELIADVSGFRKTLTSLTDVDLATGDFISQTSGSNFWKVTVKFVYDEVDDNNDEVFAEYAIMEDQDLPATATTKNGKMLARFVPSASFTKTSDFAVTMRWTFRA